MKSNLIVLLLFLFVGCNNKVVDVFKSPQTNAIDTLRIPYDSYKYVGLIEDDLSADIQSSTIYYDYDSYELTDDAKLALDMFCSKADYQRIKVVGYTCDIGTERYNLELSYKRAESVKRYLEKVWPGVYVDAVGFGEFYQLWGPREKNRRAVVEVVK